jgi:catechol 2,3-dioxygenase-like lactoylglutathione lyase family enzyme
VTDVIDHVTIRVSDRAASERFYTKVLAELGIDQTAYNEMGPEWDNFTLTQTDETHPVTRSLHIGFRAPSREHVDKFWSAGIADGHRDDGAPGPRPVYAESYYGAFLLDPDGNSAEAVHGDWLASREALAAIDHLWIRVADVAAAKRFYELVASFAGLRLGTDDRERAQFRGANGTFSLVAGAEPTENLHLAFSAPDNATVERFHDALTGAGYETGGAPGERAAYHPGYFGAFVLDPDGNNIELVCHNR